MKEIEGFERYSIDRDGVIYLEGRVAKVHINPDGYRCKVLRVNNKDTHKRMCRVVAQAFIPNPNNYPVVNHINSIRDDDRVENLEWCSIGYNKRHGILANPFDHKGMAGIDEAKAIQICELLVKNYRHKDIAEILDTTVDTISRISSGTTWRETSCKYVFPAKYTRVTKTSARWVFKLHLQGSTPLMILGKTTNKGLTLELIEKIISKQLFKEIH